MADPKQVAEQIEQLAHSLKEADDYMSSFSKSLDLAKNIMMDVRKAFVGSTGPAKILRNLARDAYKDLENAKDVQEQMTALKNAELKYQTMLSMSISKSAGQQKEIIQALEHIVKLQDDIGKSALAHSVGLNRQYSRYVEMAKAVQDYGKTLQVAGKWIGSLSGSFPNLVTKISGAFKGIGLQIASLSVPVIGLVIGILGVLKKLATSIFDVFKNADEAAAKFRKELGVTREFVSGMDRGIRRIAIGLSNVGATFEMAYASAEAVVKTLGSMAGYTDKVGESATLFAAQFGIAADQSVRVLKAFAQISRSTIRSQTNVLGFVAALSQAAGTNLHEVMGDIAEFSESGYRFLKGSTTELAKAAVEARRMGTTINAISKSASGMLNFTQSIASEMEASVLLGKSIDLTRARQLSFLGDMAGLSREIYEMSRRANFEHLDPITMKAVAAALGLSEGEIGKIIQSERELAEIQKARAKDSTLNKQITQYEELIKLQDKQAKNYGEQYLQQLKSQANQTRLVAIQQQWNKLVQELAEDWLPVVNEMLSYVIPVMKGIAWLVKQIASRVLGVANVFEGILLLVKDIQGNWVEGWKRIGAGITKIILGPFAQLMPWIESHSPHRFGEMWIKGFEKAAPAVELALSNPIKRSAEAFRDMLEDVKISADVSAKRTPPGIGDVKPISAYDNARIDLTGLATDNSIMRVVESINRLREDMLGGKIGANVRLDSQVLSETIRRSTEFRGGYGTNNAKA